MLFDKITKKAVTSASKVIKEKTNEKVNNAVPIIVGISAVLVTIFTLMAPTKEKATDPMKTVVVNNFYIGGANK